ncbi:MAG: hypothetical protein O7B25_04870 [Gammaproteobacteria bacterium]|nr:hypothetical protein [Gammaproteobacteria bacterium]
MAAQLLFLARTPGFHEKSGKPYCAMLVEMILDRTVGKPVQAVVVHKTEIRPPAAIHADIVALVASEPRLIAEAIAAMAPAERAKLLTQLPVDTTAEGIHTDD